MKFGDSLYYTCQTAEKGYSRFTLTATGEPGHGSVPRNDNAVIRLTETVSRIGRATLPTHITDTVRTFITTIADDQPDELRTGMTALLQPERAATVLPELDLTPEYRRLLFAITRNTATPTVLDAGGKINVIPSSATARVDGRMLPGFDQDSFYAELETLLSDDVTLDFIDWGPPLESPQASPLYDTIEAVMAGYEPEATLGSVGDLGSGTVVSLRGPSAPVTHPASDATPAVTTPLSTHLRVGNAGIVEAQDAPSA